MFIARHTRTPGAVRTGETELVLLWPYFARTNRECQFCTSNYKHGNPNGVIAFAFLIGGTMT
jgi:hypothetical protein